MLGPEGGGFTQFMMTLDGGRISIGAMSLGSPRPRSTPPSSTRGSGRQFGRAIADFQAIQLLLADIVTELEAARLLVYQTARLKDRASRSAVAAMAKLKPRRLQLGDDVARRSWIAWKSAIARPNWRRSRAYLTAESSGGLGDPERHRADRDAAAVQRHHELGEPAPLGAEHVFLGELSDCRRSARRCRSPGARASSPGCPREAECPFFDDERGDPFHPTPGVVTAVRPRAADRAVRDVDLPPVDHVAAAVHDRAVLVPPASLPASGSVKPKAPRRSPEQSAGRYFRFCSSVPKL